MVCGVGGDDKVDPRSVEDVGVVNIEVVAEDVAVED